MVEKHLVSTVLRTDFLVSVSADTLPKGVLENVQLLVRTDTSTRTRYVRPHTYVRTDTLRPNAHATSVHVHTSAQTPYVQTHTLRPSTHTHTLSPWTHSGECVRGQTLRPNAHATSVHTHTLRPWTHTLYSFSFGGCGGPERTSCQERRVQSSSLLFWRMWWS